MQIVLVIWSIEVYRTSFFALTIDVRQIVAYNKLHFWGDKLLLYDVREKIILADDLDIF